MPNWRVILWLGIKELRSFRQDIVLLVLVAVSFTFMVYSQANGMKQDLHNAAIAMADEDNSRLSRSIADAFLPPQFARPVYLPPSDIDRAMETGRFSFAVNFPPDFEADLLGGRTPDIQVLADATVSMQAGIGIGYIHNIISREIAAYLNQPAMNELMPARADVHILYNQNLESTWFVGAMAIINNVTLMAVILCGGAFIREKEHGTLEHLLVMPVTPADIMLSKVWANGLIILCVSSLSLYGIIHMALGLPLNDATPLFLLGTAIYLFFATGLGIFLGTVAHSMPQLGLLFVLVILPIQMLSGGSSPFESMPEMLQTIMQLSASTHYVELAQAILFRGAGLDIVWRQFTAMTVIALLFFAASMIRFRRSLGTA